MKWCEIFRTGEHTDSKGNKRLWTFEDLLAMERNFKYVNPDVPICCGHPKTNSPAYGWFEDVKAVGNSLYACFKNVQPEFKEAVNKGLFKTRSISLMPDLTIRHLAFLGAQSPAIKGLEQFCFADCEQRVEGGWMTPGCNSFNAGMSSKELPLPQASNQAADCENDIVINFESTEELNKPSDGHSLHSSTEPRREGINLSFNEANREYDKNGVQGEDVISSPASENEPKIGVKKVDEEKFKEELKQKDEVISDKDKEIQYLKEKIEKQEKEKITKEFQDFCDTAISEGHILPSQKREIISIMEAVNAYEPFEFEDSDGKIKTETAIDMFKKFVFGLRQMDFEEIATQKKVDNTAESINFQDAESIAKAIISVQNDYKLKGIDINSAEALAIIKK